MIIIGEKYENALREPLSAFSADILWLPDNPDVDPALSGHADLSVFAEGEEVWLAGYLKNSDLTDRIARTGRRVRFPETEQKPVYPGDVALNVCVAGERLFYNPKTASPSLVRYLTEERGLRPVPVRQGYTKCCTLPAGREAVITSDEGIASAANAEGMDVLKIAAGSVELEGFDYGFIGGAAFRLDDGHIAFTGSLEHHPEGERIAGFIRKYGFEPVFLTDRPLFDIGGAVIL